VFKTESFEPELPGGLLRSSAVRAVAALRSGLPVVGYESVWTRGSAVP
jgi:hypothetical protein